MRYSHVINGREVFSPRSCLPWWWWWWWSDTQSFFQFNLYTSRSKDHRTGTNANEYLEFRLVCPNCMSWELQPGSQRGWNYEVKILNESITWRCWQCSVYRQLLLNAMRYSSYHGQGSRKSPSNLAQTSFISATSIEKCRSHSPPHFIPNPMLWSRPIIWYCRLQWRIWFQWSHTASPSSRPPTAEAHGFEGDKNASDFILLLQMQSLWLLPISYCRTQLTFWWLLLRHVSDAPRHVEDAIVACLQAPRLSLLENPPAPCTTLATESYGVQGSG